MNTQACFSAHMGFWLMDPSWLSQALAAIRDGTFVMEARAQPGEGSPHDAVMEIRDGVAIVALDGPLMKGWSKYGGTSTVAARNALRTAMHMDSVRGALLHIDSPGGHVAGTQALADDVWSLQKQTGKPIHAHIEDQGASAAFWIARQASRVTANPTAMVGSVGVIAALVDTSKAYEEAGVKLHVITTGKHKATGVEGAPIDDEQIAEVRDLVEGLHGHFVSALKRGGMTAAQIDAVSDGRVVLAKDAVRLGMVDEVMSADAALASMPRAPRRERMARGFAELRERLGM